MVEAVCNFLPEKKGLGTGWRSGGAQHLSHNYVRLLDKATQLRRLNTMRKLTAGSLDDLYTAEWSMRGSPYMLNAVMKRAFWKAGPAFQKVNLRIVFRCLNCVALSSNRT